VSLSGGFHQLEHCLVGFISWSIGELNRWVSSVGVSSQVFFHQVECQTCGFHQLECSSVGGVFFSGSF